MPPDRAAQRVRFFDQYRSYVINYNLGKDLVRRYIGARRHRRPSRRSAGRSSRSCSPRRGCRPACGEGRVPRRRLVRGRWRCLPGRLRLRLHVGPRRHADPLGRLQLLRLPALLVHPRRHHARRRRRRLLRGCVPGIHRDHPLARHPALGQRASDRRRADAGAVLPVAHALSRWTNLSPDGFTLYYQHAAGLAGRRWTFAGPVGARRAAPPPLRARRRGGDDRRVLFGTNLYHYATFDSSSATRTRSSWSPRCSTSPSAGTVADPATSLLLGLVRGFIVLTRHTNVLFLLVIPLYGVAAYVVRRRAVLR